MKGFKRRLAWLLIIVMVLQFVPVITPALALTTADMTDSSFNGEGLWITEIYNNDVDRSTKNDTRAENGYQVIPTYESASDLMEFIEVCNTHDEPIKVNDLYQIDLDGTVMPLTDMSGSSDVTLTRGQIAVLWNYRTDIVMPTEAEFRKALAVPDSAVVLKLYYGSNWVGDAGTFTIKNKSTGETVSTFSATKTTHTLDGLSVHLKMPVFKGSTMEVYRALTLPSAGRVQTAQVNGLIQAQPSPNVDGKGLYITEILPNDINRSSTYGTASDVMECLEVTNTSDHDITFNTDVHLVYTIREGSRKPLTVYKYSSSATNFQGSSSGCVVGAGETVVLWNFRYTHLTDYTSFPTLSKFRSAFGISSDTKVYIFTGQNGLTNDLRGLELYTKDSNGDLDQCLSRFFWHNDTDCPDGTSVDLKINPEGPDMLIHSAASAQTLGTVVAEQTTFLADDGSAMELRLYDGWTVPKSIMQGEDLRVFFYYKANGLARTNSATYYRLDGTGDWILMTEGGMRVPNRYEVVISGADLFDHDYVEFYVEKSNAYRTTRKGIYRVDINKLNDVDGVRTNISEGEVVRGTVAITGNDGGTNKNTKIYIDGVQKTTTPMLEDGAYFNFSLSGIDSYFRTAITTNDNDIIHHIGKWAYLSLANQVRHIDSSYFTYSSGEYKLVLRIWSGTVGYVNRDPAYPDANRDDFQLTHLKLKLPNGKEYLPSAIGPSTFDGVDTSAKTNLSTAYDAVHNIGDSKNWCPYIKMTFKVPEADVNAVGVNLDTTTLSEGKHTLKVVSGSSTKTVTFIVDNTAPSVDFGFASNAKLTKNITLNPTITEANNIQSVNVMLNNEPIEIPYATTAYALGEGTHTLAVEVTDQAGNTTSVSRSFVVDDISMTITDAGAKDITNTDAQLYLSAQSDAATSVTFYKAEKIDSAKIQSSTVSGIVPHIQYIMDVSGAAPGDEIRVKWNGTASGSGNTHATTMFIQNVDTGAWTTIGTADSTGSIEGFFPVDGNVKDGKATVIVQCTANSALPDLDTSNDGVTGNNSSWNGASRPNDYDFSFAWITDTQIYVQKYQNHYLNMCQWIVDNAEEWKIKYLMHTGDLIDDWDAPYQWENSDAGTDIFDAAGLPYGVLAGNHDVAAGHNDYKTYVSYYGEDRFTNQPTYGGSYKNNLGHYDLVSENGQDFIIVYMSWSMNKPEIDWMNEVLAKYSDRKAILCFHGYTHSSGSVDGLLDYFGVMIRDNVVAKNPNVFAVLNGHYHGASYQTVRFDDNGDGKLDRTVYQICTDYQKAEKGGLRYIKFLYFDLDNDKVFINSYSPYLDDYNYFDASAPDDLQAKAKAASNGVANKIDIDPVILTVDFDVTKQSITGKSFSAELYTKELLGTAELTSGGASANITDLTPETTYQWYAVLENENTGYLRSDVYEFTTEAGPVHDYQTVVTEPTCETDGYTTYTCSKCGDSYTDDHVAALGHDWVEASCTEAKHCNRCGKTDGTALGHSYSEWEYTVQPGCETGGEQKRTCSVCGFYQLKDISSTGHSYEAVVTAPDCEKEGFTTHTCSGCGDVYISDKVAALGHSYKAEVTAPTCTEKGYTTYICTVCNDSYVGDEVAAPGHSYETEIQNPTCTEEGSILFTCTVCGDSYSEAIASTGHSYVDGTCTNCGAADPDAPSVIVPTLNLDHPSLSFEGEIMYNLYFTADDLTSVVEMGLIAFSTKNTEGTIENAENVYPGYIEAGGMYMSQTAGVPARYLGDAVYFKAYAKLSDGSYVYSGMVGYNAAVYAKSILKNSTNDYMKRLVVAMINYGAEAQAYFCGKEGVEYTPMNNFLTADQQALINAYDASMVADLIAVDSNKVGMFTYNTGDFAKRTNSVSFDGAFAINYYFTAKGTPDNGMEFYYWNTADYLAADVLTPENATGSMDMVAGSGNQYWGQVSGIAAKEVDQTYFVAGVYELDGVTYTTGILAYSLGKYCAKLAAGTTEQQALSAATAVYGYYAKEYFANI